MSELVVLFSDPYYTGTGGGSSDLVPAAFDVALGGRHYMLDLAEVGAFRHQSIELIRQQADQSSRPGEASINPEDFWRRSVDTWQKGAGQRFADRDDSDPARFRASKGIDPWTFGQISLLPATAEKTNNTGSNLAQVVAGTHLYYLASNVLSYTTDASVASPSLTTVTASGTSLSSPVSIASSGYYVWVCDGTDLYYTTRGNATYAAWHSAVLPGTVVRYVRGRLIVAGAGSNKHKLYNSLAQGTAVPSPLYTHADPDFNWVDFAESANHIYLAGYSGDKSIIYRTQVKADGTALDVPVAAGELPDGEIVRSVYGYLGFLLIGTDNGVRFAVPNTNGDLEIGATIDTPAAVKCFEGQDRFVWFGWTNYDSTSTGLGRIDLSVLNGTTPGYASDLMATTQGAVNSVVTFQGIRHFAVAGDGFFGETTNKVASATVQSGYLSYGLPDSKTAVELDTQYGKGAGTITPALSVDEASFETVGEAITTTASVSGHSSQAVGYEQGELFEVQHTITRDATDATLSPVLTRWTLRADPSAKRRFKIFAPLVLHRRIEGRQGAARYVNVREELAQIRAWAESKQPVTWQEGSDAWTVVVENFRWHPMIPQNAPDYGFDGVCQVELKTLTTS